MKWLYHHIQSDFKSINEPLVNCQSCEIHSSLVRSDEYTKQNKCCEFTPFWSAFAVGAWIVEGGDFIELFDLMEEKPVLTLMGLMHSVLKRRQKKSLCHFYDSSERNCRVWQQRPATCSTFFCTSGFKKGLDTYSQLEDSLLNAEAALLLAWFKENKWDEFMWAEWCLYMEKEAPMEELNIKMVLTNKYDAQFYYLKAYQWLMQQKKNESLERNIKIQLEQSMQLC